MQNLANSVRNSQLQVEAVTHYHQVLHCTSSYLISSILFPLFLRFSLPPLLSFPPSLPASLLPSFPFSLSPSLPLSSSPSLLPSLSLPLHLSFSIPLLPSLSPSIQPSAVLINSSEGDGGCEEEEGEEEEVCVVGSVEYYSDFCLDWRGVPVKEIGGGEGGKAVEWKPNEDTSVLYPTAPLHLLTPP